MISKSLYVGIASSKAVDGSEDRSSTSARWEGGVDSGAVSLCLEESPVVNVSAAGSTTLCALSTCHSCSAHKRIASGS